MMICCTRLHALFVFFLAVLSLSAVRSFAEPITVTDATGHTVTLPGPAERIVSLAPSVTETLFAIGLSREIIGVTDVCNYPPEARSKTKVGGVNTASAERILSLRPDLVLEIESLSGSAFVENLRSLGLTVVSLSPDSFDEIVREIGIIGRLTGRDSRARALSDEMARRVGSIERRLSKVQPVSVLYVLWHDPLMTLGKGNYISDLVARAGGRLVGEATSLPYYRLGIETVLRQDPETILIPDEIGEGGVETQMRYFRRWPMLRAVKSNRIFTVDADLLHRPGPRVVEGIETMARRFHPELFP
jgi:iron complex transport system substrate-binding protein